MSNSSATEATGPEAVMLMNEMDEKILSGSIGINEILIGDSTSNWVTGPAAVALMNKMNEKSLLGTVERGFFLTPEQRVKFAAWLAVQSERCHDEWHGSVTFSFRPYREMLIIKARHSHTGDKIDLTEY